MLMLITNYLHRCQLVFYIFSNKKHITMKYFTPIILLLLAACGRESSPQGRAEIRHEIMQRKMDSLMQQNRAILDSIHAINKELHSLQGK